MIDWSRKKVADLIDGLTAGVSVRSIDGRGYGPAVLKTSAVDQGRFVPNEVKTILPADRHRARCNPMAGSLIMSRMNTPAMVGDVGYVRNDYPDLFLPDRLWLARSKRGSRTDMRWLTYLFASEPGAALLHGLASGTSMSMQSIPKDRVLELEIHTPPPAEQHAIGDALESADDLIATLERLIAKKQAIKQGMMQQLLTGRLRLPGFGVTERVSTDVGLVPAEWKITSLDALRQSSRTIRYGIVQPGTYDPNGRLMLRGQDYSKAKGWANPAEVFRVSDAVEERYKNARLRTGDLIMTIVGYAGHVEVVPDIYDGANITQTTARIPIDSSVVDPAFCKYVLQSPIGQHQVDRFLKGAAQPGLNIGDVAKFLVCLPGRAEQEAISAALSDVDAQIRGLQLRLTKTRAVKQGMMQQLLTGRTRLPVEAAV